ncbi:hypothetical protein CORT_0A02140 [Candida orthopsilosis Co 90-125]|uniref:Uncharacterized protein n=1 Tax=Candida orthopsilosis (strain 90-125) TaxID=1136231 RepID=H8WVY1_CANO9|nr:hypothetical protein CORT_0A02140 [Candida orthopsilosis Co 90-125]CCG20605.1 hypothetical protein CORT_0A02140 [Candida orthopsilosis Co 90-125]
MFSSDLSPRGIHHLWSNDNNHSLFNSSQHSTNNSETKHYNKLFAPPLSSYTAAFPGPDPLQLEYLQILRSDKPQPSFDDLSLLMQMKEQRLMKIRNTGYSTIRPIGIGKTMEELDYAQRGYSMVEDSAMNNNVAAENSNEEEMSTLPLNLAEQEEVDLDAEILDADELQSDDDDDDDDNDDDLNLQHSDDHDGSHHLRRNQGYIMDDEGFMAAEVEYQDDHSLNSETNTHMLISSAVTASVLPTHTTGNRTSTTNPTTAPSFQTLEEQHFDNENEYSEQDMLVD